MNWSGSRQPMPGCAFLRLRLCGRLRGPLVQTNYYKGSKNCLNRQTVFMRIFLVVKMFYCCAVLGVMRAR